MKIPKVLTKEPCGINGDMQQFLKLSVGGIKYEGRPGILHQAVMMEHSVVWRHKEHKVIKTHTHTMNTMK